MAKLLSVAVCHQNLLFGESLAVALSQECASSAFAVDVTLGGFEGVFSSVPDVLILDSRISLLIGMKLAEESKKANCLCRLLLLSSTKLGSTFLEIASLGADGCVAEESPLNELQQAIHDVYCGKSFCSPQIANEMFAQMGRRDSQHAWSRHLEKVRLTPREREVLELIALERLGNKQIARRMSISLYTVKNHVHNIIEKLGAEDRYEAAEMAKNSRLLAVV